MASLCGRVVLSAARKNVTYTPVRFCKSKWKKNDFFKENISLM